MKEHLIVFTLEANLINPQINLSALIVWWAQSIFYTFNIDVFSVFLSQEKYKNRSIMKGCKIKAFIDAASITFSFIWQTNEHYKSINLDISISAEQNISIKLLSGYLNSRSALLNWTNEWLICNTNIPLYHNMFHWLYSESKCILVLATGS